jgi:hypothetical protein
LVLRKDNIDRREFLKATAAAGVGYVLASAGCRKQKSEAIGKNIAACGIDCSTCPFPHIHESLENAQKWVGQFREWKVIKQDEGAEEIMSKGPFCMGCRGDRSRHWSANCQILKCCVDEKGLNNCSQCGEFPCEKLVEWSRKRPQHARALARLKKLKENM